MISVIVPVYNTEKYLRRCIDSVLAQSFIDFELLLINDGSKDNSGTICDEYAKRDNRVRVFHKKNGGVSSARNIGIENAKGKWITFVDSDDTLTKNALELMHANNNEDIIIGAIKFEISQTIQHVEWNSSIVELKDFKLFLNLNIDTMILRSPCFKLFKKDIILKNHIKMDEKIVFGEDSLFVAEYLIYCKSIHSIKNVCYNYYNIGGEYVHKYKQHSDSIYDFCYKIKEKYNILKERFGLNGNRIVFLDIYDVVKLSIYDGNGSINKFREFLLLNEVKATLKGRSTNINLLLLFAKSKNLLISYLFILKIIRKLWLKYL